jgi:UDP-N-acetylglucosamine--N-acetylmuramyl-(pentapeptide) pyrophosphoryl-undecaprenol N-acetylglucosamine transferase
VYSIYPDVVVGKGGYGSVPTLFAAKLLRIPVLIHESDSHPGRANLWAGKFARKIAVSYPQAVEYFKTDKNKIAWTGNPIRPEIAEPLTNGAHEFLGLESSVPTVLVLGGSQGSQIINDAIIGGLAELLNKYQVIHQVGKANLEEIKSTSSVILKDHPYASRYRPFDYLNELSLRMSAGASEIVISRAGSTIFEIASWGKPSIIVPLPESISHDQTSNAITYTQTGAGSVIEENNLTPHVLIGEINRIHDNVNVKNTMSERAKAFARLDSAKTIALAILDIALEHEK